MYGIIARGDIDKENQVNLNDRKK
jgi:hypothetical protein